MPQGGSRDRRPDRGRSLAAERREIEAARKAAERQARLDAAALKEQQRAEKQRLIDEQIRTAEAKSPAMVEQITALDSVLSTALTGPPLTFDRLRTTVAVPPFDPGRYGSPALTPVWDQYAPTEPRGLDRLMGMSRYRRELADAQARFDADTHAAAAAEDERRRRLAAARAEHGRRVEQAQSRAAARNADVAARRTAFASGEPEAVEWFVDRILSVSRYPDGFPRRYQVAYRPQTHDVVVEFELPPQQVVPVVREYRYAKARDTVDPVPRPANEIRQRYARLIACVTLRTLHEIFTSTPADMVEAVIFNGRVDTIDLATGKQVRPHLISVEAERADFTDLVLARVDPAACLRRLKAKVSTNPFDLDAVEPFITFDLKRFRFADDNDALTDLDSRPNLLKLTPTEFERLVKDLFEAMGAKTWRTVPSKDGGVDAVATSDNMFFGGVCLIQAKRWTGVVGLDAVHALTGVMTDHNATTGVLVTTSWFSRTSEQFAGRNRIKLINGAELKHLIKEHLKVDVIPGTTPPKRVGASKNTQTGKPGPAA